MPITKRNNIWYIHITAPSGERIRRSTGTGDEKEARQLHDKMKYELWHLNKLGEKPKVLWDEVCLRWIEERQDKKSIKDDKTKIRKLAGFRGMYVHHLTKAFISAEVMKIEGTNATRNRYLAFIRSILNACVKEWDYLDSAPTIRLFKEPKKRIRWLRPHEADRLVSALPQYIAELVIFSLCTGLRKSNVLSLEWSQIDLKRKVAWYYPDETKSGYALGVPLSDLAMQVLDRQLGKHPTAVFINSHRQPIKSIPRHLWKKALQDADIQNFRWHDLRHTWASWLVQRGVPLYALKEMGGWESIEMVQRYAHLAPEHLHQHAALIDSTQGKGFFDDFGTNLAQTRKENTVAIDKKSAQPIDWTDFNLVPAPRVELGTF